MSRNNWVRALCGFALALLVAGCRDAGHAGETVRSAKERASSPPATREQVEAALQGNSEFAFALYRHLRRGDENLFLSPHSISVALAMTYAGARGGTERQMAQTLRFYLPQEDLHPALNALDLALAGRGEGAQGRHGRPFQLHIANALWGQEGYEFLPAFLDLIAENYGAGLRVLDFVADTERARGAINRWVEEETEKKIRDLIPQGMLTSDTRLVLTNAIYFDAAWAQPFQETDTRPRDFTRLDGRTRSADMMHARRRVPYAEGDGWQAIELPYDGEEIAMVALLPARDRFEEFESGLDASSLTAILDRMQPTEVEVALPKFSYETAVQLKETLTDMGMGDAFLPRTADFSGMDGARDLFLQEVIHKALVRVDEEGTEAAAATAVVVGIVSMPMPAEVEFIADRPFVFLIRDRETGAALFLGRMMDPTA